MQDAGRIADYELVDPLADGGHGRFHLAVPPARLGLDVDRVVVKVVAGGDDTAFRRFTRELKLFARVAHPNLVRLYDAGQHEDRFFYSMEWCPGGSLEDPAALDRSGRIRAVAQAARAAHALHESGIVHRDIRPGNVLVRADGSAALADLGLAQLGSSSMTSMAPMASIGFVDPELLRGGSAGRPTDVYALAATLHRVLTAQDVFAGLDPADPMLAVRTVLRRPPTVRRDLLDDDVAAIIEACLDVAVEARPPTAEALADLLDGCSGGTEP